MAPLLFLRVFLPFALGYFISYFFRNVNAIIEADLVGDLGFSAASPVSYTHLRAHETV